MRTNRIARRITLTLGAFLFAASMTIVGPSAAYADGFGGDPPPPKPSGAPALATLISSLYYVSAAL